MMGGNCAHSILLCMYLVGYSYRVFNPLHVNVDPNGRYGQKAPVLKQKYSSRWFLSGWQWT